MNFTSRNRLLLSVLTIVILESPGCSVLHNVQGFKKQAAAARAMVHITGTIMTEGPVNGTLVVILASPDLEEDGSPTLTESGDPKHTGRDTYSRKNPGTFLFVVDAGNYRLGAYEDQNKNGLLDPGERLVQLRESELLELGPGEQGHVDLRLTNDRRWDGPAVDLLQLVERDVREQGRFALWAFSKKGETVGNLSEKRFARAKGTQGLWRPMDFLNEELAGIYFLDEYDPDRIPILFVHGIMGYPQQFEKLIDNLDRSRFQPWFYFYPSGVSLDRISSHLSDLLREIQIRYDFEEIGIVAHSMGGLVSRGAILKYFHETQRDDIEIFVSINSPFGGSVSARRAADAPIEIPESFKDMNPESAYATWVYYEDEERTIFKTLPGGTPHHMITGFGGKGSGCTDGTVSCASQLPLDLMDHSSSLRSYEFTHVGTLQEQHTLDRVTTLLENAF